MPFKHKGENMMETQTQAIDRWNQAANREDREGNHAAAITFRNMAWLLEHQHEWLPQAVQSAEAQVKDYLASMRQLADDFDDIT